MTISSAAPVRYHLSSSNKPAKCNAEQRACPRGHFDTLVEAQTAAVEKMLPAGTPEAHLLAKRCAELGVDPNGLRDVTGKSLTDLWSERLVDADAAAGLEAPDDVIRSLVDVPWGRERGWGVEWRVPGESIDSDDDAAEIGFDNDWDKHLAAGEVPVMYVHTRNGGGNRECYCDDVEGSGHEPGCLEQINEGMQDHPLYLHDEDDTGDYTYANFYFRVPESEHDRLRQAYTNQSKVNRARFAESTRRSLAAEDFKPQDLWAFFQPNRETQARKLELRTEVTALRKKQDEGFLQARLARTQGFLDNTKQRDSAYLAKLESFAEGVLGGEEFTAEQLREVGYSRAAAEINTLRENRAVVTAAAVEAAEREDLLVRMRELDPALAYAAAKHMNPTPDSALKVKRATEQVDRIEKEYKRLVNGLRARRQAESKIAVLDARLRVLLAHERFPGDPEKLRLPQA